MFVIKSIPNPENSNFFTIAGALVHIWVIDTTLETAKQRAIEYIQSYLWTPQAIEHEFEISEEQIVSLHKDEVRLYQKAQQYGIAADFLGWLNSNDFETDNFVIDNP